MALAAQLALEIPEREIDGVAGGAGRQQGLQPLAVQPVGERPVQAFDLAEHALHRFAVARIGHRLAASHRAAGRAAAIGSATCREEVFRYALSWVVVR